MQEYEAVWRPLGGSKEAALFGFRFDVGLDPVEVNVERMVAAFQKGCQELGELWTVALQPETYARVRKLGENLGGDARAFHLEDELWTRVILDFACAYKKHPVVSGHLMQSLTPLYLARVASFVQETRTLASAEVETKIEQLCLKFEELKPYLISQWAGLPVAKFDGQPPPDGPERGKERIEW